MSETSIALRSDVLLAPKDLFSGVDSGPLAALLSSYSEERRRIDAVVDVLSDEELSTVVHYFLQGNVDPDDRAIPSSVAERLFAHEGAVKALDAEYWRRALDLTDVLQVMPQKRRDEWWEAIRNRKVPEFSSEVVVETLGELLASRYKFFAEKVDGAFRRLSGDHVTNRSFGFSKRMIFSGVTYMGTPDFSRCGHVADLRSAIAKFLGMEDPPWNSTYHLVNVAFRNHGEWMDVDGGSFRMRAYLKGTVHLEVHPDMAWRLNCVLHSLHPRAIAEEHRRPEKKILRGVKPISRPIPYRVTSILGDLRREGWHRVGYRFSASHSGDESKVVIRDATRALEYLGGVVEDHGLSLSVEFDYDAQPAIDAVVTSGCLPDVESHQYYPTPEGLARDLVDRAEVGSEDEVLEPSAGQGSIASLLPRERTTCVEVNRLHAVILRQRGFRVVETDFLAWDPGRRFDRVVANPPFDRGRWRAHLDHMAELTEDDGRLVVILPASQRGKDLLPGWGCAWSEVYRDEFAGAGADVAIMTATRDGSTIKG